MLKLLSGRGPVHLSLPRDSQLTPIKVTYEPISSELTSPHALSYEDAQRSLALFNTKMCKIALLVGKGLEEGGGAEALYQLATRWSLPFATTLRAKGLFPEDHPLSLGVFGYAGTHHARIALLESPPDLLIVLSSGLNERDSMHWTLDLSKESSLVVNQDPVEMSGQAKEFVTGDAGAYLRFLLKQPLPLEATKSAREEWLNAIKKSPRLQDPETCNSSAIPIHPARIIAEMQRALPKETTLLIDSGAHRAFAGHYWQSTLPGRYISATNLGPMGWAIPAAIGVQCARPKEQVAVITGDGCMHMQGIEIATATRHKLPIIYVVINIAALGNVWLRSHTEGAVPAELTTLPDIDWAAFSRSLGGNGITVTDPEALGPAFSAALKYAGPTVIDVKADKRFPTPVADWQEALRSWSY